MKEQLYIE